MAADMRVINFMRLRTPMAILSGVFVLACIVSLVINGLKFGLDFTGGTQIEVSFDRQADLSQIRSLLVEEGLENPVAVLFGSETEVLIRTQGAMQEGALIRINNGLAAISPSAEFVSLERPEREQSNVTQVVVLRGVTAEQVRSANLFAQEFYGNVIYAKVDGDLHVSVERSLDIAYTNHLLTSLADRTGSSVELRRSEFVGPQVGEELRDQGGLGILASLAAIMIYVAFRFQYKFSVGAVAGLAHDAIVVVGIFSLLGKDFDLTVLAAVLAVIGYSLNNTIVIFDRVRENFRKLRKETPEVVINISLTQTLERTIVTSASTLMVLVVLYFAGGELINGFATALIIGILTGSYTSIYVASSILLGLDLSREDMIPPPKEGEDQQELTAFR